MSLDLFLQDFSDEPSDRRAVIDEVLAPLLDADGENIVTTDGSAAVFGASDAPLESLMFNHIDGVLAWDVIYQVAAAADWAILTVGGPVCVPARHIINSIPDELAGAGVVFVESGRQLREAATRLGM